MQDSFPLREVIARQTVHQHLKVIGHGQLGVREQCSHTEAGVGGQNTQLHLQFCRTLGIVLHPAEQFLAHLISHGIRDDHHSALLGILDIPGIEVPLQGQLREGIRLLYGSVPLGQQRLQILVGVDVLHEVAQRLKGRGVLNQVVGRVETAVLVIKSGVFLLILPQDVLETVRAVVISGLN